MSDVYPRQTLSEERDGRGRIAYRVSEKKAHELLREAWDRGTTYWVVSNTRPPRFRVKMDPASCQPVVLFDASRPAYRGRFYTLERAMLEIDNVVRRERSMPTRFDTSTLFGELGRAMRAPIAFGGAAGTVQEVTR